MKSIGGINLVKTCPLILQDMPLLASMGSARRLPITTMEDIDQLLGMRMVWYCPNQLGKDGWWVENSPNYVVKDYLAGLANSSIAMPPELAKLIKSFQSGITQPVEAMVAYDTSLKVGLIVDGTKRALTLCHLRQTDQAPLAKGFAAGDDIHILKLSSPYCLSLFFCDFAKLHKLIP